MQEKLTLAIRMIRAYGTNFPELLIFTEDRDGGITSWHLVADEATSMMKFVDGPSELDLELRIRTLSKAWTPVAIRLNRSHSGM